MKQEKEVHLRRRLGGNKNITSEDSTSKQRSPTKEYRRNEIAKKIIEENFLEVKDELPAELGTRSGIRMALDFHEKKMEARRQQSKAVN